MHKVDTVYSYKLEIAETIVHLSLQYEDTAKFFGNMISREPNQKESVTVLESEWNDWLSQGGSDNGYGEYTCLTAAISDDLLKRQRCIMHAVAFRFNNEAWLISGKSGAGKSTQTANLQSILPGEFGVICGDRPVLQICDHSVIVHPSPWNGKENWKGAEAAPLAGLIILQRGEENSFESVGPKDAIHPVMMRLIHPFDTEEGIRRLASFEDQLLRRVPVYKLTSHKIPDSSYLLYSNLFKGRLKS